MVLHGDFGERIRVRSRAHLGGCARARKIGPKRAPPKLEREEELQVILDFKRRQKEERKREKADKPKKKKKKKGKGADAEGNVETEADAEATEASEATVTVDSSAANRPPPRTRRRSPAPSSEISSRRADTNPGDDTPRARALGGG